MCNIVLHIVPILSAAYTSIGVYGKDTSIQGIASSWEGLHLVAITKHYPDDFEAFSRRNSAACAWYVLR